MSRAVPRRLARPSWPALTWLGLLVVGLVAGVVLVVNSDAGNTDVRTADGPPANPAEPLPDQLSALWSAQTAVDDQRAVAGDTVITTTEHGVAGLDPRTGEQRWRYLRPNATMCDLTVLDDVVVAIFRTTGRCNEAVALEAGSGVRRWYRNVGFSEGLRLLGSGTAALAATPGGIAVLDAVGNSIRWRYNPPQGCELSSIGIGFSGVVALERCQTGTTWLALFELYGGNQLWRVAPPAGEVRVLGAEGVVSLLAGDQLTILSARNGALLSTLAPAAPPTDAAAAMVGGQPDRLGLPLIFFGDRVHAIEPTTGAQLWTVAATGLPAASDFGVVVPEPGALVTRNPVTGAELSRTVISGQSAPQDGGLAGLVRVERTGAMLIAVTDDRLTAYG